MPMLIAATLVLGACGGQSSTYISQEEEQTTADFGVRDFRTIVNSMVDKMTSDENFRADIGDGRPTLLVTPIVNRTDEHIDTASINDSINVRLSKARLFTFVSRQQLDVLRDELALAEAGIADATTVARMGRVVGARYVLSGTMSSIRTREGRTEQIFYKVTLTLTDIENAIEIWIDETEVSKRSVQSLL